MEQVNDCNVSEIPSMSPVSLQTHLRPVITLMGPSNWHLEAVYSKHTSYGQQDMVSTHVTPAEVLATASCGSPLRIPS